MGYKTGNHGGGKLPFSTSIRSRIFNMTPGETITIHGDYKKLRSKVAGCKTLKEIPDNITCGKGSSWCPDAKEYVDGLWINKPDAKIAMRTKGFKHTELRKLTSDVARTFIHARWMVCPICQKPQPYYRGFVKSLCDACGIDIMREDWYLIIATTAKKLKPTLPVRKKK